MYRIVPQWLARWWCGRKEHRYVTMSVNDQVYHPDGTRPSAAQLLPDGTMVCVYTCRCGNRQEVKSYGGQFPLRKS